MIPFVGGELLAAVASLDELMSMLLDMKKQTKYIPCFTRKRKDAEDISD